MSVLDVVRGSHVTFRARFIDESGEPLVASNEVESPAVQIKDPLGEIVYSGVGRPVDEKGTYDFEWFAPEDIELSTKSSPYSVNWFFTDLHDYTKELTDQFFIVDAIVPEHAEADFTYLTRIGKAQRVILSLDYEPTEISVEIKNSGFASLYGASCVADSKDEADRSTSIAKRKIGHMVKNGLHYYYFETDPLNFGEYPVFWDTRLDDISEEQSFQQIIRVPENNFWLFVKPLQLIIDKLKKKYVTFQAYGTDQLYEFMIRGVGDINGINPVTSWTLASIPTRESMGVAEIVLAAAARWALTLQQVLEEELAFDHGGQTVTLGVKHDYSSIIGLLDGRIEKFEASKLMIQRICGKVGAAGVRPYRYGYSNRVWKLGLSGTTQDSTYGVNGLMAMLNL